MGKWHVGRHGGGPENQGFDTSILSGHADAPPSYFYTFDKVHNGLFPRAGKNKKTKKFPKVSGKKDEHLTDPTG